MNKVLWQATCLALLLFFNGCAVSGPGSAGSTQKYFETFFVGEEGMQYFIKPIKFNRIDGDGVIETDFLFRYKNEVKDSATVNISLISDEIIKEMDSLVFSNESTSAVAKTVNLMFNEKKKRLFYSRFSAKTPFADMVSLFENPEKWQVVVHYNGRTVRYQATNKTTKTIHQLNQNVFVLFR